MKSKTASVRQLVLSPSTVTHMECMCTVLAPFAEATTRLSGEILSFVMPIIKALLKKRRATFELLETAAAAKKSSTTSEESESSEEFEETSPKRQKKGLLDSGESSDSSSSASIDKKVSLAIMLKTKLLAIGRTIHCYGRGKQAPLFNTGHIMLAKKLLCIPATFVPSEHLFSTAGNIVTKKRASLDPDNVECLRFWLRTKVYCL